MRVGNPAKAGKQALKAAHGPTAAPAEASEVAAKGKAPRGYTDTRQVLVMQSQRFLPGELCFLRRVTATHRYIMDKSQRGLG